jgi:hypothetical protein
VRRKQTVFYIELLADQFEYLPMTGQVVPVKRDKASAKAPRLKKGG